VKLQTFGPLYSGLWDCAAKTVRQEGVRRGLYAGTAPALVAYISENSVLFWALGRTQQLVAWLVGRRVEDLSLVQRGLAGSAAATCSGLVLCPTELVKCRLQAAAQLGQQGGVIRTVLSTVRKEGVSGLWRGLGPTWCRELPGYFCFFLGYESSRAALAWLGGKQPDQLGSLETVVSGGVAGVCFWSSIFPMDVVKSRIQVRGARGGAVTVARQILKTEGAPALYRGLAPALVRTFPANAALFLAYENSKRYLSEVFL